MQYCRTEELSQAAWELPLVGVKWVQNCILNMDKLPPDNFFIVPFRPLCWVMTPPKAHAALLAVEDQLSEACPSSSQVHLEDKDPSCQFKGEVVLARESISPRKYGPLMVDIFDNNGKTTAYKVYNPKKPKFSFQLKHLD